MKLYHSKIFLVLLLTTASLNTFANTKDNPFASFFGLWTLKEDTFHQVWDGKTVETLTIPNHLTLCEPVNTAQSVLCKVRAGDFAGHILWTMNTDTQNISHLSHFGAARHGVGTGTLDDKANFTSRVSFQGEPPGSYRIYRYQWLSADEYEMKSVQYSESGEATGNWYGGTFIRLDKEDYIKQKIIETNRQVRQGFVDGDIDKILAYHHKDVEKVFAWDNHQKSHHDMRSALEGMLTNYHLSFEGDVTDMRSLVVEDEYATMIADFTLVGTPKTDQFEKFTYSGVTMILYVRDESSPTGWSTLREMAIGK